MQRIVRFGIVVAVVLLVCGVAAADTVDPQIIIRGRELGTVIVNELPIAINPAATAVAHPDDCRAIFDQATQLPGFQCTFLNNTGAALTQLSFSFGGGQGPLAGQAFAFGFNVTVEGDNTVVFSGGSIPCCGPFTNYFTVDFLNFSPDTTFLIAVPEPATGALLLVGLGGLVVRRRRRAFAY